MTEEQNDEKIMQYRAKVRLAVLHGLLDIAEKFDSFIQTTHGVLSEGTWEEVISALIDVVKDPSAYNISTFDQHVRKLDQRKKYLKNYENQQ